MASKTLESSILYQSFESEKLTLANRVVMPPMSRRLSPDQIPDDNVADYYARRAEQNVGLIITEGALIDDPAATASRGFPFFHGAALEGWKKVVEKVHAANGAIIPEIWHLGAMREDLAAFGLEMLPSDAPTITPSGLSNSGKKIGEPMTTERIEQVITAYAKAAGDAKRLGFDGVEIHGGHGCLIDQFFWEKTNKRTDLYGGDLLKRTRLATEVVKACRQAVGEAFPILFRFSQCKDGFYDAKIVKMPKELEMFLGALVNAGVDIFDCASKRYWQPEFEGSEKTIATWTKELSGKPVIAGGSVGLSKEYRVEDFMTATAKRQPINDMIESLARQDFDLIAVGRALLGDYAWSTKVKEGRSDEIGDFTPDLLLSLN